MSEVRSLRTRLSTSLLSWASVVALSLVSVAVTILSHSCSSPGCLGGDKGCIVPSPCAALAYECSAGDEVLELRLIDRNTAVPGGLDSLGAVGDILIGNDQVVAVVDALDHPAYLAPSGGTILDLSVRGQNNDSLNHILQSTGLLPDDAAFYDSMSLIEEPGLRAIVFRGYLAGHPEQRIATRYEVRPCEPGIRVRTEAINGEEDAATWSVADGLYWGGREAVPFIPSPGRGFEHPEFELTSVGDVYRDAPFVAAVAQEAPSAAYSVVRCDAKSLSGFHSVTISSAGAERKIVQPRDGVVYDRFVAVANGQGIEPAVALAHDLRRRLFAERAVQIRGRIAGPIPPETSILVTEGAERATRIPWTETRPNSDGSFVATVPANKNYELSLYAFGRVVSSIRVDVGATDVAAVELSNPAHGTLDVGVNVDGLPGDALVFVYPADDETEGAVRGRYQDNFVECAPMLGAPHGDSPACNRIVVTGRAQVAIPVGRYDVYASHGIFASLARETIAVRASETASITMSLTSLPLMPSGSLSADFHVHGSASFDSSLPERDRVRAFLASGLDVIAATDHDVVSNYEASLTALNARPKIVVMSGLEATGHILFEYVPDTFIPKVIGHWNFWPYPYDAKAPRRGAMIDDLIEPGELFDRAYAAGFPESGVIQLNHPLSKTELGRDLGFAEAIGVELDVPLKQFFDGTGESLVLRTPPGATRSNGDYHVQEVMNGSDNTDLLAHRAYWFHLLRSGVVRAGTANSDSHGLTDNVLGIPRTVVQTTATKGAFDAAVFNADVKAGHMLGTNGPVLEVRLLRVDGSERGPSTEVLPRAAGDQLEVRVSAAPWVPIDEVRIIVDGAVVLTLVDLAQPTDPFSSTASLRLSRMLPLESLLPATGDTWVVVEAGATLPVVADLDCNGIPDTGDNNGDGVIDTFDVERDEPLLDLPEPCDEDQDVGPFGRATKIARGSKGFEFQAVVPDSYPFAFTNPFLFDDQGNGFRGTP